jgi:hypothetical protein
VGGVSVHGLEDRQKVDMHCYWSELGEAVYLGHGSGILCVVVERFCLVHIILLFFMTSHSFYHIDRFLLNPFQGLALCIEDVAP